MKSFHQKCLICLIFCCLPLLTACAADEKLNFQAPPAEAAGEKTLALVVKDMDNPYMINMADGFAEVCEQQGYSSVISGPTDGIAQTSEIEKLIAMNVSGIAIAANDADEASEALQHALRSGIPVVSLDSVIKPEDRIVHIQQAPPEIVGRVLIQAAKLIMNGEGQFAILTTTEMAPNQASWLRWMLTELEENQEQYDGMELVDIVYGLDEPEASTEKTEQLLTDYPDLKVIIAPTCVGMKAAADTIQRLDSRVKLTGLGLPSDMESAIMSGICPWMYLWNPADLASLAAYTLIALDREEISGETGEILYAGTLGTKKITASEDGGSEIVLGNPKSFDSANVAVWAELF